VGFTGLITIQIAEIKKFYEDAENILENEEFLRLG
jgi:hypothetical protein